MRNSIPLPRLALRAFGVWQFGKSELYVRLTAPPTHRPLYPWWARGSACCSARLTHIALALQTPNFETGFAYSGSGNVVGGHPLAAIQIAISWI